ncbi:MAG: RdgB/HAM1 family non-canonical purine NTP pyrophosphatase [Acidobacteria bacterium]|nr:RdgB/HAM1 family non-canonical purine NTP pyrophosphatase [Acidobacteriota bacterium]
MNDNSLDKIVIATRNLGKVREMLHLFQSIKVPFGTLADHRDTTDIEETGTTFAENAELKAAAYAHQTGHWCLADDSGLEVAALDGRPGVLSARYGGADMAFAEKMSLLLNELEEFSDSARDARFVCVMALADKTGRIRYSAEGECCGRIALAPRGNGGFGYDPIFVPAGYKQTFGELSPFAKNQISHRTAAAKKILRYLLGFTDVAT